MKYVWVLVGFIFFIKWFMVAIVEGTGDGAQYIAVFLACFALFKLEFVKKE